MTMAAASSRYFELSVSIWQRTTSLLPSRSPAARRSTAYGSQLPTACAAPGDGTEVGDEEQEAAAGGRNGWLSDVSTSLYESVSRSRGCRCRSVESTCSARHALACVVDTARDRLRETKRNVINGSRVSESDNTSVGIRDGLSFPRVDRGLLCGGEPSPHAARAS